jgi:aspartyl-tRNA(Asn)/glutamyl-tRNA(Gln) amidotransferase subunit A
MTMNEPWAMSIEELSRHLRTKAMSPVELVSSYLECIAKLDKHLNAYITVLAEKALADARSCESAIVAGDYLGPLHGIPIALKDVYDMAGVRTTAASKKLLDHVPHSDSTVAKLLRSAGAVIIGKTNMHEWALGATNARSHFGPTRNPWDLNRMTGGSSGGSAAAVSAGLCAAATGTDTGGSIRIPGALCGVVGLKPTYGRVSCAGVIPVSWSLDHAGVITRSVYDAAVMLGAIAGWDENDPATLRAQVPAYDSRLSGHVDGVRVGVDPDLLLSELDPEVAIAIGDAIDRLAALGAKVVEVKIPQFRKATWAARTILDVEAAAYHEESLRSDRDSYLTDGPRARLEEGLQIPVSSYVRAQRIRQWTCHELELMFDDIDLLAMPTCPVPAPLLGESDDALNGTELSAGKLLVRFTRVFNLTGLPAITIPCGFARSRLPIGLQLASRSLDECTLLRVAHSYERSTEWRERMPPVSSEGRQDRENQQSGRERP